VDTPGAAAEAGAPVSACRSARMDHAQRLRSRLRSRSSGMPAKGSASGPTPSCTRPSRLEEFVGKTRRSIRTIPLSETAMAAHRSTTAPAARLAARLPRTAGRLPQPTQLATPRLATRPRSRRTRPTRPNALRHTFATSFLVHSDDRWLLAKLMGTGVDMIELHYGHLIAPHASRSRAILDQIWAGFGRMLDATLKRPTARCQRHSGLSAQRSLKRRKPSNGLEPLTPSLPWKCSTN
jgi:integrase